MRTRTNNLNWNVFMTLSALCLGLLIACKTDTAKQETKNEEMPIEISNNMNDSTPRVTGIGGIFFKAGDPAKIREWYGANLGLAIDDYGSAFEFRNANRPDEINYLRWGPFGSDTEYFNPSEKEFMINYRVQYLEALVEKLEKAGVAILDSIATYEYGKFVHIMDPEGNKIELWEPNDRFFTEMGGPTTK